MKERPILFNSDMVRAILSGDKTQMRRMVKYIPALGEPDAWCHKKDDPETVRIIGDYRRFCPFGNVGDQLWVREAFKVVFASPGYDNGIQENGEHDFCEGVVSVLYPSDKTIKTFGRGMPSIHMPRWASRITLEIINVRVEQLQWIDDKNAGKEGIRYYKYSGPYCDSGRLIFKQLWNSIYGNWDENPWVWVIEFKRVEV